MNTVISRRGFLTTTFLALPLSAAVAVARGAAVASNSAPIFSLWNDADWHWTANNYYLTMTG